MKKSLALVLSVLFAFPVVAANDEEKIYTQKQFDDAVVKEVERRMVRLGRKEIVGLSKELMEKERELKLRELELEKTKTSLEKSSQELADKIKEFEERQNKLIACLDNVDKQKASRVNHMVETIGGMRPQQAADLLSVQDSELAVEILGKLDAKKISKIFNLMDKKVSAKLQKQYMTMKK